MLDPILFTQEVVTDREEKLFLNFADIRLGQATSWHLRNDVPSLYPDILSIIRKIKYDICLNLNQNV